MDFFNIAPHALLSGGVSIVASTISLEVILVVYYVRDFFAKVCIEEVADRG